MKYNDRLSPFYSVTILNSKSVFSGIFLTPNCGILFLITTFIFSYTGQFLRNKRKMENNLNFFLCFSQNQISPIRFLNLGGISDGNY